MQRGVLIGAGAAVLAVVGFVALRSATRHQAGQAVDQSIGQLLTYLPPGYAVRHGVVDYNPLTSAATVHDLVVTHDGAPFGTAATLVVSGADQQALHDVFIPDAYPTGKPAWADRRLLIADASAHDIHLTIPGPQGGNVTVRDVTLHRLSGRPFIMPPTPENRVKPQFQADAALAFSVDSVDEQDIVAAIAGADKDTLTIGATNVSDYDGGKAGSVALKRLALDGDGKPRGRPFHLAVAAVDIKDADVRAVLEAVRTSGRADRSQFGHASYGSGNLAGLSFDMSQGPHVALAEMHASQTPAESGPATGEGFVHGLVMAVGQSRVPPSAAPALAAFGANAVTMDVDATSKSDAAAHTAELHEDVVLRDLGTFHLQGSVSGYNAAASSNADPLAGVLGATLDHASIVFEDHSLTNRVMAVAAASTHTTPELIRAQLAMPVVTLGLMVPDQPDAADQVTAFINHPHTLTITMTPPQKMSFGEVGRAPASVRAHLLGMHITAG